MILNEMKVIVRLKEHETVVHDTFKCVYKSCILEKVCIDFSRKKIRGSFMTIYASRKNADEDWIEHKPRKTADWFDFDNPNITVEIQIADQSSVTIFK